jgi:RNA polymerase sigma-70 factor (ECF subfamily)
VAAFVIAFVDLSLAVPTILGGVPGDRDADDERLARERALVERAHAGDRAAIGELLSSHGPTLYRTVLLPRLGAEAAARDALSEVYQRVIERFTQFRWQNVGVYPWLRVVAMRVAIDHLRARKRLAIWEAEDVEREVDAVQSSTPVDDKLAAHRDRQAARARVEAALERIHERYARAIRLRVLEERPREEVAQLLGVTAATFDVVLHRAMAAMKKALVEPPRRAARDRDHPVDDDVPSSEAPDA